MRRGLRVQSSAGICRSLDSLGNVRLVEAPYCTEHVGGPSLKMLMMLLMLPLRQSLELPGCRVNVKLLLAAERLRLVPLVLRDAVNEILAGRRALPTGMGGLLRNCQERIMSESAERISTHTNEYSHVP
jgi:hypothetical protein